MKNYTSLVAALLLGASEGMKLDQVGRTQVSQDGAEDISLAEATEASGSGETEAAEEAEDEAEEEGAKESNQKFVETKGICRRKSDKALNPTLVKWVGAMGDAECQKKCMDDATCVAAEYNPVNKNCHTYKKDPKSIITGNGYTAAKDVCYVKENKPEREWKKTVGMCRRKTDKGYDGPKAHHYGKGYTIKSCKAKCIAEKKCVASEFTFHNKMCYGFDKDDKSIYQGNGYKGKVCFMKEAKHMWSLKEEHYAGCHKDQKARDLPVNLSMDIAPKLCLEAAREKGYRYAGLQFGKECWASHAPASGEKLPESSCQTTCKHDANKKCGGTWANAVFDLDPSASPVRDCSKCGAEIKAAADAAIAEAEAATKKAGDEASAAVAEAAKAHADAEKAVAEAKTHADKAIADVEAAAKDAITVAHAEAQKKAGAGIAEAEAHAEKAIKAAAAAADKAIAEAQAASDAAMKAAETVRDAANLAVADAEKAIADAKAAHQIDLAKEFERGLAEGKKVSQAVYERIDFNGAKASFAHGKYDCGEFGKLVDQLKEECAAGEERQ